MRGLRVLSSALSSDLTVQEWNCAKVMTAFERRDIACGDVQPPSHITSSQLRKVCRSRTEWLFLRSWCNIVKHARGESGQHSELLRLLQQALKPQDECFRQSRVFGAQGCLCKEHPPHANAVCMDQDSKSMCTLPHVHDPYNKISSRGAYCWEKPGAREKGLRNSGKEACHHDPR